MTIVGGIRGDASRLTFRRKFYQIGIIFGNFWGLTDPPPLKKFKIRLWPSESTNTRVL